MTSEEGVSVTHTLDGEFAEATQAEKALANLRDGVAKLGQTLYYSRNVEINLPGALFVPNSLLNQLRRETAEMLDDARLKAVARGSRKPVSVPPPVYPETHLSFLANVYNHKAREFYQRYGVQLIDAAYEAHEEKGDVPVDDYQALPALCLQPVSETGQRLDKELESDADAAYPR
ncbi:peptidase U32 [Klebsiella grimontii]|uniref:Peptidase U32 n=1 Tax=Klebsiella grimontii TaxID=2058152 RepID=A0A7H4P4D4_9ENTR|nr:peptidase U32 [Klebsiella grimontii]